MSQRAIDRTYDRWVKNSARVELKTVVYERGADGRKGGCALCGGPVTVSDYVAPFSGSPHPEIKALVSCVTCQVDRVKRWNDLFAACPAATEERLATFPWPARRPVLERHGLVRRVPEQGAWELTPKGEALLQRFDEEARK